MTPEEMQEALNNSEPLTHEEHLKKVINGDIEVPKEVISTITSCIADRYNIIPYRKELGVLYLVVLVEPKSNVLSKAVGMATHSTEISLKELLDLRNRYYPE